MPAEWPGVDYRSALIGDGWATLKNVSHVDAGVLRRRPGFGVRVAAFSGQTLASFGGRIVLQAGTSIVSVDPASGSSTSLATGVGSTAGCFARYLGRMYWVRGDASSLVFDTATSTSRTPGIAAPGTAITGSVSAGGIGTVGGHIFRYRYKNTTTGFISNPSEAITLEFTDTDKQASLSVTASATSGVDQIILEVTAANGAVFYQASTHANATASVAFNQQDAVLTAKIPAVVFGDDGHNPMPSLDLIAEHRNRLFGIQRSTRLIGWSRPGFPESWDLTSYGRRLAMMDDGNDTVTALVSFLGDLYLMQRFGMSRFSYVDDPSAGVILVVPTQEGCWNQRCFIQVADNLFGFGPAGCWAISAINPKHISTPIDPWLEEVMDTAYSDKFFVWYNWRDRSVSFAFVAIGDTEPKVAATFSLRTSAWSTRTYEQAVTGACVAYNEAFLCTAAHLWKERPGLFDGVATGVKHAVAAGSTTTVVNTAAGVSDYVGATLTIGAESRVITGYGANSITVGTAFSSAPAAGTVARVGMVPVQLVSDWRSPGPGVRVASLYALLQVEPVTAGEARFSSAIDFQVGVQTYTSDSGDTYPNGVQIIGGATEAILDLAQAAGRTHIPIPLPAECVRCMTMTLTLLDPVTNLGIMSMDLIDRGEARKTPGVGE